MTRHSLNVFCKHTSVWYKKENPYSWKKVDPNIVVLILFVNLQVGKQLILLHLRGEQMKLAQTCWLYWGQKRIDENF